MKLLLVFLVLSIATIASSRAMINDNHTVNLTGDGKDAWILDIDQTALSLLDYYSRPTVQFGAEEEHGTTAQVYKTKKRTQLVAEGYRVHGNMGDQWSDLIGDYS
ncbi:acid phosphatase 1-like protein, partial [Tanacetum coccineum]